MTHLQRVAYVAGGLLTVIVLIVMITLLFTPVFNVAHDMGVGPFQPALDVIETVTYWLLVPIFGLSLIAYLIFGPAQEEVQKDKRRRNL